MARNGVFCSARRGNSCNPRSKANLLDGTAIPRGIAWLPGKISLSRRVKTACAGIKGALPAADALEFFGMLNRLSN
jgi:hypothetical protein